MRKEILSIEKNEKYTVSIQCSCGKISNTDSLPHQNVYCEHCSEFIMDSTDWSDYFEEDEDIVIGSSNVHTREGMLKPNIVDELVDNINTLLNK